MTRNRVLLATMVLVLEMASVAAFSCAGEQGPRGERGPAGPAGPAGADGADGLSAYQIWLGEGNTGTEADFLASLYSMGLNLNETPGDHGWSGFTCLGTAGENLTFGELCYFKSDGKWWKTDADAAATTDGHLALATASISADSSGTFLLIGFIRDDTWAWATIGGNLYVSTDPGAMTQTEPSATGDQVRKVGVAHTADITWFCPDWTLLELS